VQLHPTIQHTLADVFAEVRDGALSDEATMHIKVNVSVSVTTNTGTSHLLLC